MCIKTKREYIYSKICLLKNLKNIHTYIKLQLTRFILIICKKNVIMHIIKKSYFKLRSYKWNNNI